MGVLKITFDYLDSVSTYVFMLILTDLFFQFITKVGFGVGVAELDWWTAIASFRPNLERYYQIWMVIKKFVTWLL